jgi:hypothetical protein
MALGDRLRRLLNPPLDPAPRPILATLLRSIFGGGLFGIILWFILWVLGLGWVYPFIAPFLSEPEKPAVAASVVAAPAPEKIVGESPPPPPELMGWAGPEEVKKAWAAMGPPEVFSYTRENYAAVAEKCVVLWPYWRMQHSGTDPPNIKQVTGDCVSRGWCHGAEISSACHQFLDGDPKWARCFPPYIYGTSRFQIGGGRISGAGSTGRWADGAAREYGFLLWDSQCPPYTTATADGWGRTGPPQWAIDKAKQFTGKTRLVTTFDEACVAISMAGPVPVCSGQGFQRIVEANGRIEGRPSGSWAHCMVFIGFDTRAGRRALYCLNSWGPNAHASPERYAQLDGAPPGGFWVDEATANRMLGQKDSYAIFFHGFGDGALTDHQNRVINAYQLPPSEN